MCMYFDWNKLEYETYIYLLLNGNGFGFNVEMGSAVWFSSG